jgi:hypothetical protein
MLLLLILKIIVKIQVRGLSLLIDKVVVRVASYLIRLQFIIMNSQISVPLIIIFSIQENHFWGYK